MEPEQAPEQLENDTNSRHGGAGKWIVIVAILTVIAVLLVPTQEDGDKSRKPLPPVERPSLLAPAATEGGEAPSPPPTAAAPPSQAGDEPAARDTGPGAAARRLILEAQAHSPLDLDAIWNGARRFEDQGQLDDAYLLYYFAASRGHGPAAMKLGREADPADFEPGGLFRQPDAMQAHKWYRVAARAGIQEARAALQVLKLRVEKAAANGDERARGLMLLWK